MINTKHIQSNTQSNKQNKQLKSTRKRNIKCRLAGAKPMMKGDVKMSSATMVKSSPTVKSGRYMTNLLEAMKQYYAINPDAFDTKNSEGENYYEK